MLSNDLILVCAIFLPLVGAVSVTVVGKIRENVKVIGAISSIFLFTTLSLAFYLLYFVIGIQEGKPIVLFPLRTPNATCFVVDGLSAVVAVVFSFISSTASLYSIGYLKEVHATRITQYYIALQVLTTALNGIAYSGDLFTLFIFTELCLLSAVTLVAFYRSKESVEASIKYLVMGSVGAACILMAVALIYGVTGTLNIALAASILRELAKNPLMAPTLTLIFCLLLVGFGVESAMVPLHSWLIDAHPAAPFPIHGFLSGAVIKSGIYAFIRTGYYFFTSSSMEWSLDVSVILFLIAMATITLPNLIALRQTDVKRLLAYSSIYNMGVVVAGIAVGTPFGLVAALFHIINHAIVKAGAMMTAGDFYVTTHTRNLLELKGIARKMPVSGVLFSLNSLSLAGLPPLNTFYSKLLVIIACFSLLTKNAPVAVKVLGAMTGLVLVVNAVISIGYYIAILVRYTWMSEETEKVKNVMREAPPTMILGLILLLSVAIAVSLAPFLFFDWISKIIESFMDIESYKRAVLG